MKKTGFVLGLFLAVMLAVSPARGDSVVVDGVTWYYSVQNGTATITSGSYSGSYSGNLSIPAVLNGYKVTRIGGYAFDNSSVKTVIIPNTVTTIDYGAFSGCSQLMSVVIPNSVTTIGESAFASCWRLPEIRLPNSVTAVGSSAFYSCSALKSVTLPRNLKALESRTFYNCTSLTSLTLPEGLTTIGDQAFYNCRSLTALTLPGVTAIGTEAFRDCTSLTSLTLPEGGASIGPRAFYNCRSLPSLTLPDGVADIETETFRGCSQLAAITLPNTVTNIRASAFAACSNLTDVAFPASVEQIDPTSFRSCSKLTTFAVAAGNPAYVSWNGLLMSRDRTELLLCPEGRRTAAVPATVVRIGDRAFYGCALLRTLAIPESVRYIGTEAFYGCRGLTRMSIPLAVEQIGSQAFGNCPDLRDFSLPSRFVMSALVNDCSRITNLVVTAGSTNVCDSAFADCRGLQSLTIPPGVGTIGSYAFYNCTGLTSVSLPTGVRTIGSHAFQDCDRLPALTLPDGLVSVGDGFVDGCDALARLSLPATLQNCGISDFTQVGRLAEGVDGLWIQDGWLLGCVGTLSGTIAIPEGVRHLASFACYGQEDLERIDLPASLETVGAFAFDMCPALLEVHVPSVSAWTGLFFTEETSNPLCNGGDLYIGSELLTDLVVPEGVTEIGDYAFRGCTTITNVVLPSGVTNVASTAFAGCPAIVSATLNWLPDGDAVYFRDWTWSSAEGGWRSPAVGSYSSTEMQATVRGPRQVTFQWRISPRYYYDRLRCYVDGVPQAGLGYYENDYTWVTDWRTVTLDIPAGTHTIRWVYSKGDDGSSHSGEDCGWVKPSGGFVGLAVLFPDAADGLERVTLGAGMAALPSGSFAGCTSLTSVSLPSGLREVGSGAFAGCTSLARVDVPDLETWMGLRFADAGANPTETGAALHVGGRLLTDLVVPEGVTEIGAYAFHNCTTITNVVLPSGVTNVAATAFAGCPAIVSATLNRIPDGGVVDFRDWTWSSADGGYRSPVVGIRSSTEMQATVRGPRQVTFQWRISPRYYYDRLRCYVDGVQQAGLGYYENNYTWVTDWRTVTLDIPAGTHTVRWVYSKEYDGSSYSGEDCGWVKPLGGFFRLAGLFPDAADGLERVTFGAGVDVLPDGFFVGCPSLSSVRLPSTLRDCGDVDFRVTGRLAEGRPDGLWIQDGWVMGYLGTAPAELVIPEGIRHIAPHAFDGQWESLVSVDLPETLQTIGACAFRNCTGLMDLRLPDRVESVGPSAFENDSFIQDLSFGTGLKRIGAAAFRGCVLIKTLDFPEGLESIGDSGFEDCRYTLEVDIPASVTNIGVRAFAGCTDITGVRVTTGVRTMADLFPAAVRENLQTVHVPEDETYLVPGVFSNCTALLDVDLPAGVTEIPDFAFQGCASLTNVYWSGVLASVGRYAFDGCTRLLECPLPPGCRVDDAAFRNCRSLTALEVPEGNVRLGNSLFEGCTSLAAVTIPRAVTSVGANALRDCSALTSVVLPEGLSDLGDAAFSGCTALAAIDIPSACTNLGTSCFAYCRTLREIVVPDAVTVLRAATFSGCSGVTHVTFPRNLQTIESSAFLGCGALAELDLPEGLQTIGDEAFRGCSALRTVSTPASLRSLGAWTFAYCGALERFPFNNVKAIGAYAFRYCPFVTLEIPDGVERIGEYAFADEASLREVRIPLSVTDLGTRAFYRCAVTNVTIPSSLRPLGDLFYNDYYYPRTDGYASYDYYYLTRCIQSVRIVEGSPSVCDGFLQYCSGLSQIAIPDSVTRIGSSAFASCSGLKTALLPSAVASLGASVFSGSGIETVYFLGNAPAYDGNAYSGSQGGLTNFVARGTRGWDGTDISRVLPKVWPPSNSRAITYWDPHTFDATFVGNGGSPVSTTVTQTTKTPYVLPDADPVRANYVFAGWWTSAEADRGARISSAMINEFEQPLTFYAHWKTPDYHVRFDANGGAGAALSQGFLAGASQRLAANTYTRPGWAFAGWATAPSGGASYAAGESFVLQESAAADITLYAQWTRNAYAVAYDARGGAGEMAPTDAQWDEPFALPTNAFTRTGHAFVGWTTNGTDAVAFADGETVSNLTAEADGTVTLGAVWSGIGYTLVFDANGGTGTMASEEAVYGTATVLPRCAYGCEGRSFVGWATGASGTVLFGDGAAVSNLTTEAGAEVRLYAVWAEDVSFVRFHANGASGTMGDESFVFGLEQELDPCAYWRAGYAFKGWALSPAGDVAYADGARLMNPSTEDGGVLDLYAVWEGVAYRVVFDANGGAGEMADGSLVYDESAELASNAFTRVGHTFRGWSTSSLGEVAFADAASVSNLVENAEDEYVLYAVWEANRYAVVFDANGGTGAMEPLALTYGQERWLPPNGFARYGYAFAGWSTNATDTVAFGDQAKIADLATEPDATVTMRAVWSDRSYTVAFAGNGGAGAMGAQSAVLDTDWTLPDCTFTRDDYVFTGWSTSAGGTIRYGDGATVRNLAARGGETVTLYACWRPVSCTLTFDANGGAFADGFDPRRTVPYDASVALPSPAPVTWRFHEFAGWNPAANGSGTAVTGTLYHGLRSDVTLYAQWRLTYGVEPAKTVDASGNAWYFVPGSFAGTARLVAADVQTADATIPASAIVAGRNCSVVAVAPEAFADCTGLRGLVVPDSVTDFPMEALAGCDRLESLTLPSRAPAGGAEGLRCFDGRSVRNLKSVVVPEGYDLVCFVGCSELVSVSLPSSLKSLRWGGLEGLTRAGGDNVFAGCWKLEKLVFNGRPPIDCWQTDDAVEAGSISGFVSALLYADSVYYPEAFAAEWQKVLGNFGYGGVTGGVPAAYPVARMVQMAEAAADAGPCDFGPFVTGLASVQASPALTGSQVAGLPRGMKWDAQTGMLSGAAREPGVYAVTVESAGGRETMMLRVDAMPEGAPALSPEYAISCLGLEGAVNTNMTTYVAEELPVVLGPLARPGYVFKGWTPNDGRIEEGTAGDVTFTAIWEVAAQPEEGTSDGGASEDGAAEPSAVRLYDVSRAHVGAGETAPYETAATVYDGYLLDASGAPGGTIQVRVAKGKVDKKTGGFAAKVVATAQTGSGKVSFKGGVADATGAVTRMSAGGHVLDVTVGPDGLRGTLDGYEIDGARNLFVAKGAGDKSAAQTVLSAWQGTVNVVADGLSIGVSVAAKGKVKVSGTVKGAKVSATGTLLVGERYCAIPVRIAKKADVAFMLWMPRAGGKVETRGLKGAEAGKPGEPKGGATFRCDAAELAEALASAGVRLLADCLPDGVSVDPAGAKWIVAGGAKPGKVVLSGDTADPALAGANPSGLKLSYKPKDGSFKGTFKAYAVQGDKVRSYTVGVTGVLIDGVGHGTATLKTPACSWPVTVW